MGKTSLAEEGKTQKKKFNQSSIEKEKGLQGKNGQKKKKTGTNREGEKDGPSLGGAPAMSRQL